MHCVKGNGLVSHYSAFQLIRIQCIALDCIEKQVNDAVALCCCAREGVSSQESLLEVPTTKYELFFCKGFTNTKTCKKTKSMMSVNNKL